MEVASPTIVAARAYGDFTILLAHANAALSKNPAFKIIASSHLAPLYKAFIQSGSLKSLPVEFTDCGIQGSLLRFFTNKQLLGSETWVQLRQLIHTIHSQANETIYLEQTARLNWLKPLVHKKLMAISQGKNVYADYATFFKVELPSMALSTVQSILILPSSRQAKKNLPDASIVAIQKKHPDAQITVGLFRSASPHYFPATDNPMKQTVHYSSFEALIHLIQSYDFIYCPDSAQAHICQLLQKPHFMLYPNQYNLSFATPFVIKNKQYASFRTFELAV